MRRCLFVVLLVSSATECAERSGAIVVSAYSSARWRLYQFDPNNPHPVELESSRADAGSASISPDSSKLVFTTSDGALWVRDLSVEPRGSSRKLGARFSNGSYGHPTWIGPEEIAYTLYTVTPPTEDSDIYAYSLTENKQRSLVRQTGSQDYPAVSPEGGRIAYMSSVTTTVAGLGSNVAQQLWISNLRTGKVEQVTIGGSRDTHPAWSPDGTSIAFSSDRDGNPEIWVVELESRRHIKITQGKGEKTDPCWSPDGKQILYVTTATGKRRLEIVDLATRRTIPLKPFGDKDIEVREPAWRR